MSATTSGNASKTITALSESNGVISATYADISIASGNIENFSSAIENVVSNAISSSPNVSGAIETAVDSNSAVTASKAVTDFYTGHNTVSTLANIPTTKRLVIATISTSSNNLTVSGNSLTDGYEIHIIVRNNGSSAATVTLPNSGDYVKVGDDISIDAGSIGEINIISDGTNKYVRGV
jgi:hypothetical protein